MGDWGVVLKREQSPIVLSLPSIQSKPNTTVTVPITVVDATGIADGSITVTYDSKLLQANGAAATTLTNGFNVVADTATAGQIAITFSRATAITGSGGALIDIEFSVNPNVAVGSTTPLTLQSASIQGVLEIQLQNGTLTIIGTEGDLNNDGVVDVGDSILALRLVQNLSTPNPVYEQSVADLSGDGQVDNADVDLLLHQDVGLK